MGRRRFLRRFLMDGLSEAMTNACLRGATAANRALLHAGIEDAVAPNPEYTTKPDSKGADIICETHVHGGVKHFTSSARLITEERCLKFSALRNLLEFIFACDPVDGTTPGCKHLISFSGCQLVRDVITAAESVPRWVGSHGAPATVTGASISLCAFHNGRPVAAVIIELISQDLILACELGIWIVHLGLRQALDRSDEIDLGWVLEHGREVEFQPHAWRHPHGERRQRFVTYLGKPTYVENLANTGLLRHTELERFPTTDTPGPPRPLYLSTLHDREGPACVDLVLSNRERISEWAPWLVFASFARHYGKPVLTCYEVTPPVQSSDGTPMPQPASDSIFQVDDNGLARFDFSRIAALPNPSLYRASVGLGDADNDWLRYTMQRHSYRELTFAA